MRPDTTSNSWKTNLFLIAAATAVTVELVALYYHQHLKMLEMLDKQYQNSNTLQDAETQTDSVQTSQDKPVTQPTNTSVTLDVAPATQSETESMTITTKPLPSILPRDALPDAETGKVFNSRQSSYSLLPSRVPSDDNLDRPRTPNNSEAIITPAEQERRGAALFAVVVKTAESTTTEPTTVVKTTEPARSSWISWPFK